MKLTDEEIKSIIQVLWENQNNLPRNFYNYESFLDNFFTRNAAGLQLLKDHFFPEPKETLEIFSKKLSIIPYSEEKEEV